MEIKIKKKSEIDLSEVLFQIGHNTKNHLKISFITQYYSRDRYLHRVYKSYHAKQYIKCHESIELFLQKNKTVMKLNYLKVVDPTEYSLFVDPALMERNSSTIKTIGQLAQLLNKKTVLINRYRPYFSPFVKGLVIHFITPSYKKNCQSLMHEINAWIVSGCAILENKECVFGDWRNNLPLSESHRKLDEFFFKVK